MRKKPILINFFAGPSSGKSTSAAFIFAWLKNKDCNVENVTEYAKRIVYEGTTIKLRNQLYITAKQYKLVKDVADYGVKLILTDSPLGLGKIYGAKSPYFPEFSSLIDAISRDFENVNVFVRRVKKYNPSGRMQTVKQSDAISKKLLKTVEFDYVINGNPEGQTELAEKLYKRYKRRILVK